MSLDLNIHNVVSLELSAPKEFEKDSFVTRKLTIEDANGQRVTLTLFGDTVDNLKASVGTSAIKLEV